MADFKRVSGAISGKHRYRAHWRAIVLAVLLAAAIAWVVRTESRRHYPGCSAYVHAPGLTLIAHGAGGMPRRMYPNSIAALDHSYANGLRIFEMDFHGLPFGGVRSGHDTLDLLNPSSAWFPEIAAWLRAHPDARLITDFKTDTVGGLERVARIAPDLRHRILPFVYEEAEYAPVRALGFDRIIFATYKTRDRNWRSVVNRHAFAAVAMPEEQWAQIEQIRVPVLLHTIDRAIDALPSHPGIAGVITNCLIP